MKNTILSCSLLFFAVAASAQEQWSVYLFEKDSLFASVLVNLAAADETTAIKKEFLVCAKVQFVADHTGFPTTEAYELVNTFEQRMDDFNYRHPEAQIVGSCMHNGSREMYIYTSDTTGVRSELENISSARFPSLNIAVSIEHDAGWAYFWGFLFPNAEQAEYISNSSVLQQLIEAGDDLSKPREVYFWFYSENESISNALKEELLKEGFSVISGSMMEGELPYALTVSKVEKVDIQSITFVTLGLKALAKKHNSVFDGWETTVITD